MKLLIALLLLPGCGTDLFINEEPAKETLCWHELRCPKTENCGIYPERMIRVWKCEETE